ncbi:ribonuclease H protein [Pyrus ussuriensis x Pyrus communis]|uniref:Ribonuclease H protein n=1 Tax=Pyrus ussuriensis x Pyrus communis TaxID=2448454 RepID=A0A5N5F498_9ROSA|nr:ribonuclease H protein [Pyrus ussuriensis x Pyrus communis]
MGRGTSWGWKGILQGRKILKSGIRWRVGDGRNIQVLEDPWLPTPRTFRPISRPPEMPRMVADMVFIGGTWKREVVERCFNVDEAHIILSMMLSQFGCSDRVIWHYTQNGVYLVKSGYLVGIWLCSFGN